MARLILKYKRKNLLGQDRKPVKYEQIDGWFHTNIIIITFLSYIAIFYLGTNPKGFNWFLL